MCDHIGTDGAPAATRACVVAAVSGCHSRTRRGVVAEAPPAPEVATAVAIVVARFNGVITEKLRSGGVLIVDNMLWHGRIFDDSDQAADTRGIRELTRLLTTDPGWIVSLIPIRDGLFVAYKK